MSKRKNKTSDIIDQWTGAINNRSPINVTFITHPVNKALNERIRSLETLYERSAIYRFLIRHGVHPLLLFTTVSAAIGYGLQRSYRQSNKLMIQLIGVVYPTYCCWKLLKETQSGTAYSSDTQKQKNNEKVIHEQLKPWLTYWLIFGVFQVLDHLMLSQLFMLPARKKYNLYKLFILYWAQNPHSRGAHLLYKYVIQKPPVVPAPKVPSSPTFTTHCITSDDAKMPEHALTENSSEIPRTQPETRMENGQDVEEEEELSIYIHRDERRMTESYRYLDGFEPPSLYSDEKCGSNNGRNSSNSSSTSSDDTIDSTAVGSRQYSSIQSHSTDGKEILSSLVTSNEAAWN